MGRYSNCSLLEAFANQGYTGFDFIFITYIVTLCYIVNNSECLPTFLEIAATVSKPVSITEEKSEEEFVKLQVHVFLFRVMHKHLASDLCDQFLDKYMIRNLRNAQVSNSNMPLF